MVYLFEKFNLLVSKYAMAQPTQNDPQFKLRLPAALKERIESAAAENNRSMNAEIVAALEEKFPHKVSIDEFFETWMKWLSSTRDRKHQEEAIVEAAEFLKEKVRPGVYVWLENINENEPYRVVFGSIPGPLIRSEGEGLPDWFRKDKSTD